MKKLLALLLALLMPICALAETYSLSVSLKTDDELAKQYIKAALLADPTLAGNADALASALQQMMDDLGLDVAWQEDAASFAVRLGGGTLLDMAFHMAENAAWLTTSLLPGYVLMEEATELADGEKALSHMLEDADWEAVCASVQTAAEEWAVMIEPDTAKGVFSGDAFEGGTKCTTLILTDMDIAALVSAMATEEVRAAVMSLLTAAGLDAAELLARFDEMNDRVADEDRYVYMLRVVRDDADALVGLSLTIVDDVAQVATVSFGLADKEAKLVVGLGMDHQNYWWEFTAQLKQLRSVYYLSGESREWLAGKEESFAYVSATNAPVYSYDWHCNVTKSGSRYLWDGSIYEGDKSEYGYLCSSSGTLDLSASTLDFSISLGDSPYVPFTLDVKLGPVDAIVPLDSTLEICSLSDPGDSVLYEKLLNQFSAALMARLLKLLPMDVILTLNQLTLSE